MKTSTTCPSKDQAYHLQREVARLAVALKGVRNDMTSGVLGSGALDKGKVDLAYDLRGVVSAIAYLDVAEYALRCVHVNLSTVGGSKDAD